jgi:predicted transcriptional regulator
MGGKTANFGSNDPSADPSADPSGPAAHRRASGELEGDVLAVLWSSDEPMTPGEVHEALGTGLAYTTVATILSRLHEKGLVQRTKAGRAHTYTPTVAETDVASTSFRSVLTRSHDRKALLQGFVASLSPDEETMVQSLLAQARRAREAGS